MSVVLHHVCGRAVAREVDVRWSPILAETTHQTGIGLSDGFCSILAIASLDEGRQVEALWRSGQYERHLFGFSDRTLSLS